MIFLALGSFAICLEAVVEFVKCVGDRLAPDRVALVRQRVSDLPDALAGPTERRLRISSGRGVHYLFQHFDYARIDIPELLAASTGSSDPGRLLMVVKLSQSIVNRLP